MHLFDVPGLTDQRARCARRRCLRRWPTHRPCSIVILLLLLAFAAGPLRGQDAGVDSGPNGARANAADAPQDDQEVVERNDADADTGAWTELVLDGTLTGWVQFGGNASFTLQRDEIVGVTRPGIDDSFLCTETEYADFELELECKIERGLNSGIQIRSHVDTESPRLQVRGYQVEIDSSARAWTGSLYDQGRTGWLATTEDNAAARQAFVLGQWNQIRILAVGSRIQTWVNGVAAIDYAEAKDANGFIGLQIHRTSRAEPLEVRWRRLRIRQPSTRVENTDSDAVAPAASPEDTAAKRGQEPLTGTADRVLRTIGS